MQAARNKRNMQMGACDSMHMIQVDSSSDLDKTLCCNNYMHGTKCTL